MPVPGRGSGPACTLPPGGPPLAADPSRRRPHRRRRPASLRERCSAVLRDQPVMALTGFLDTGLDAGACVAGLISSGLATARPAATEARGAAEQLWGTVPAAAAVLCSRFLAEPPGPNRGPLGRPPGCGPGPVRAEPGGRPRGRSMTGTPRSASSGRTPSGWPSCPPNRSRRSGRPPPSSRRPCSTQTPGPSPPGRCSTPAGHPTGPGRARGHLIVRSAGTPRGRLPLPGRGRAQIAARRHPDRKGGWLALPAMSASLALVARIAARGNEACRSFERGWRDRWADLARQAPDLASIDLVLAEALIAGADRTRLAEETA